jgi:SAM-dependent methyltransferase
MQKAILSMLRCPHTGSELKLTTIFEEDDDILEGKLVSESGEEYKIEGGIAELLPQTDYHPAIPLATAWEARATRFDQGRRSRFFTPFEISAFREAVDLKGSDWLLEVGCGRGRLSEKFVGIPQQSVFVDTSLRNLLSCRDRVKRQGFRYVSFIQAEPLKLPFKDNAFTKLISAHLLTHVANPEDRANLVKEFARVCDDNARIAVSVYAYDMFAKIRRDKSGVHPGGLSYYRFTREEFESLLHAGMLVEDITQKLQYVWVGSGVPIKKGSVILR